VRRNDKGAHAYQISVDQRVASAGSAVTVEELETWSVRLRVTADGYRVFGRLDIYDDVSSLV